MNFDMYTMERRLEMTQIIFFFLHQNQNIFLEKKHTPPHLQAKWSFPNFSIILQTTDVRLTGL